MTAHDYAAARLGAIPIFDGAAPDEHFFEDLTRLAALISETPIALTSFTELNQLWVKASAGTRITPVPASQPFCSQVALHNRMLVVPDTYRDRRFRVHPLLIDGIRMRFYAGVPIPGENGAVAGVLCVLDAQPRVLSENQQQALNTLARQAASMLRLSRKLNELWHASCQRIEIESSLRVSEANLLEANNKLQALTLTDSLTGVRNRRAFDDQLLHEWKLSARLRRAFSLLMIDIDRFKSINDRHGHKVGDQVLEHVGRQLRLSVRETDTVARYGGEEFAILLPATELADAAVLGEMIRARVENHSCIDEPVTISIGVAAAMASTNDSDPSPLLTRADAALYVAKRAGRNRVERAQS